MIKKTTIMILLSVMAFLGCAFLSSCAGQPLMTSTSGPATNTPPVSTVTGIPPTYTHTPQPTATHTPEPTATITSTPTQTPIVQGDIFQDPQSKEEFATLVEAPSPIDNPEEFAKWQDEYLKQVNERLKTYTGKSLSTVGCSIAYEIQRFTFASQEVEVVSSYKFQWDGREILVKTFVLRLPDNSFIPLSVTYPNEDSYLFSWGVENYYTPRTASKLYLYYGESGFLKIVSPDSNDEFSIKYLTGNDEKFQSFLNSQVRELDDADRRNIEELRLILGDYSK